MLSVFVLIVIFLFPSQERNKEFSISGSTMGNIPYNIKYISREVLLDKNEMDSILVEFNKIFSTYISSSEISVINRSSGQIDISDSFAFLLEESRRVYEFTDGYFDPTIGPLVNLWGFGPDKTINNPTQLEVNSKLKNVGLNKIDFENNILTKSRDTYIDFSSIAKGYAVDVLHDHLSNKKINNFFIEIGGEVRVKGKNIRNSRLGCWY